MSEREDAINTGAIVLKDLLSTLEMLSECQGNKNKLDLVEIIIDRFQEFQMLCSEYNFTLAVGVDSKAEAEA
jgi:hypothetical protein